MKSLLLFAMCALLKYAEATCYDGTGLCSPCGGSCTSDNGCTCSNGLENCVPVSTECPLGDNSCCSYLEGFYWDSDSKCCTKTPFCYPSCASDEVCSLVDKKATCVCNTETYNGLNVSNLKTYVNCEGGLMTASVSVCQLKELGYDPSSIHIINDSVLCTYPYAEKIDTFEVESLQVKAVVDWCGNIFSKNDSKIYFTNTVYIKPNSGPLITKNIIGVNFTCGYNLTMQTSLNFSLNPIQSVHYLTSQDGSGAFPVTMAAYKNDDYTDPIQQDEEIEVESMVYLGLFSPTMDGSSFFLRVDKCYGTPTDNPADTNQLVFLNGGCAEKTDIQTKVDENGNSTQARVQISTFLFNGYSELYIFCEVSLCNKTNDCSACNPGRASELGTSRMGIQLSIGSYYSSSGHHIAVSWAILAASLLGLIMKLY